MVATNNHVTIRTHGERSITRTRCRSVARRGCGSGSRDQFRDRDRICCHDISVTQCYALETLVQQGPVRLSGLAERLFLDKSTTSRVVSTLVRKNTSNSVLT